MSATQAGVVRAGARGSSVPAGAPRKATMELGGGAGRQLFERDALLCPRLVEASAALGWGGVARMRSQWSGRAVVSNVGVVLGRIGLDGDG